MNKGKTYIIVPTYNQEESTIRCFESVKKNTDNYKIMWVDNGSNERSFSKVKNFLDENSISYKLIKNKDNLGFIKATNQGIKKSLENNCDYIVFMNNDIEVYSGWLERMKEVLDEEERNGIIGPISSNGTWMQSIDYLPKQYPDVFFNIPKYKNDPEEYSKLIRNKYKGTKKEIFSHVAFFCTLLKRSLVEDIGYLSEELGIGYFDDNDYCERVLRKGWKIFVCADVFVLHSHGKTFKSKFSHEEKMKLYYKNKEIFEKKFNKGKYKKSIDEIDNIGELRLEIKRLNEKINNRSIKKGDSELFQRRFEKICAENDFIKKSKFWKMRNLYIKYKNKLFFVVFHPISFLKKYKINWHIKL